MQPFWEYLRYQNSVTIILFNIERYETQRTMNVHITWTDFMVYMVDRQRGRMATFSPIFHRCKYTDSGRIFSKLFCPANKYLFRYQNLDWLASRQYFSMNPQQKQFSKTLKNQSACFRTGQIIWIFIFENIVIQIEMILQAFSHFIWNWSSHKKKTEYQDSFC